MLCIIRCATACAMLAARPFISRLRAVPGRDRQCPDEPIQSGGIPGAVSPLSGGFSRNRAGLLQTRVPADARRHGSARHPAGVEDHGDRTSRPGRARRALRHLQGGSRRGNPETAGLERRYLLPLRGGPRRRQAGRRHAAHSRAPCYPDRSGGQIRRRRCRPAAPRGAVAHSGCLVGKRHRRNRRASSPGARSGGAQRPLSGQSCRAHRRRAARARRAFR